MQKRNFLNDLFPSTQYPVDKQPHRTLNNIKFANSFTVKTGRHRQIRILQLGNVCEQKSMRKPTSLAKHTKNSASGLLNGQLNIQDVNSFLKVEASKRQQHRHNNSRTHNHQRFKNSKNKHLSPDKQDFGYMTLNESPKKTVVWLSGKAHPQQLSNKLVQKHLPTADDKDYSSRSANLLNKIKMIDDLDIPQQIQQKKAFHNHSLSHRRPRLDQNRKNAQELAEQQRKMKLQIKRQISMDYAKPFSPPTNISAYSYLVYEPDFSRVEKKKYFGLAEPTTTGEEFKQKKYPHSHKVVASVNSRNTVQIASLTKIMTCILALSLCEKYGLNSEEEKILVGKFESNIGGTSAQLSEGETYTLEDLYYGLMLPSGNDASVAIAVWAGRLLLTASGEVKSQPHKKKDCYNRFIVEMNAKAKSLGLQKTTYANSHGLANSLNKSCAYDLGILCEHALKNKKFRTIVGCQSYQTRIRCLLKKSGSPVMTKRERSLKNIKEKDDIEEIEEGEERDLDSNEDCEGQEEKEFFITEKTVEWENTHRLLQQKPDEYIGIKTGITNSAGPCLASCVRCSSERYFIIIVLGCDKMSMRFKDTEALKKWVYGRENLQSPKKKASTSQGINGLKPSQV